MATIVRFSTNIADTIRAPARVRFSSYTRDDRVLGVQVTFYRSLSMLS